MSPLSLSPSAKCNCFSLSEVSLGSLVKALGYYYSHVLCVLFFLIRSVFGTNHWQLFSLMGEILNGKEELASKGVYCSKGLSAQQIPYGYLLSVKGEGWVWPDFLCYLQTKITKADGNNTR